MTREEYDAEWRYRVEERLGILCGAAEPTEAQMDIALREAAQAMDELVRLEKEQP